MGLERGCEVIGSDTPPAGRGRRVKLLAASAVVAALASAGVARFVTRPAPHELFLQGLAAGRRDPAAGEVLFRRAMEAAGGRYPDAQIALCHTLARQGLWDDALSVFATIDRQACRSDLLLDFGRAALQAEHRLAALDALQAAARQKTHASVAALELLMADYHEWGRQDEETAAARELTRLEPEDPLRWKRLIDILQATRRTAEREAAAREALQHDPPEEYRRSFEYILATHLIARGEVSEARRIITQLKALEGPSLRLNTSEIEIYRIEGRPDLALETARALSADAQDLPALYFIRGVAHLDMEQYEQAVRNLEQTVAAQPNNEKAHFRLAEAYRGVGREEPAGRHAKIAAEIAARRNQINDALEHRTRDPFDLPIYERLASLHEEMGDHAAARDWRARAVRISQARPKTPESD
jgi:tetratricopeptide (TPR) repeat protein